MEPRIVSLQPRLLGEVSGHDGPADEWNMKTESLSLEEFREVVEQAPIMIWRSDTTAACDYFNERWLAFTGRTAEEEVGNGWAEGVHPEDLERCLATYKTAFERREVFEVEYRLRRFDEGYRGVVDLGGPFTGRAGAVCR